MRNDCYYAILFLSLMRCIPYHTNTFLIQLRIFDKTSNFICAFSCNIIIEVMTYSADNNVKRLWAIQLNGKKMFLCLFLGCVNIQIKIKIDIG